MIAARANFKKIDPADEKKKNARSQDRSRVNVTISFIQTHSRKIP